MKKLVFFVFITVFISAQAQSPIILSHYNCNLTVGVVNAAGGTVSSFPLPAIGTNQQWDYSTLGVSTPSSFSYHTPNNFYFPQATYQDSGLANALIANRVFYYDLYYQNDTLGARGLGTAMFEQKYGIGALTGNAADSCNFPGQHWIYDYPFWIIKYPATMSSSWRSDFTSSVDFTLTITAQSMTNVPCTRVSHTSRLDTVIGWGSLRVPATGGGSLAYPVLLIKRMSVQRDSFYMNGVPGSTALLSAFGLSQNMATTTNRYLFWRENARYPLLMVNFGSNNFTTASSAYYDTDVAADPNYGIAEEATASHLSVYPNPNNGQFIVNYNTNSNKPCKLSVFNMYGQEVYRNSFTGNFQRQLSIGELGSGVYQLIISSDQGNESAKFVVR